MDAGTWLVWAAAVVSLLTCFGHVFIGGPQVAGPLLRATDLSDVTRWMAYFCWHVVTVLTLAMGVGFALAAVRHGPPRPTRR